MKKHTNNTTAVNVLNKELLIDPEESRFLHYLEKYGKQGLYVIAGIIILLIVFSKLSSNSQKQAETDFIQANTSFASLKQAIEKNDAPLIQSSLSKLDQILKSHPELHAKYDGLIAQSLLLIQEVSKADPFALSTLKRTHNEDLSYYHDYSKVSLLIGGGQYQQSLTDSLILKEKMLEQKLASTSIEQLPFDAALYFYNLIRIAMLYQKLGQSDEATQTWKEWKQLISENNTWNLTKDQINTLLIPLTEGKVTLIDYIKAK